jgi:hypothetical protein
MSCRCKREPWVDPELAGFALMILAFMSPLIIAISCSKGFEEKKETPPVSAPETPEKPEK